jgi:hypothetical protein
VDLQILHNEIVNDPAALGYAGKTDAQVVALINALNQSQPRDTISADQLIRAFDPTEFAALTQIQLSRLQIVLGAEPFSVNDTNIVGILTGIFTGKPTSLNAMGALRTYLTSRAAILGLEPVTVGDVQRARVWS